MDMLTPLESTAASGFDYGALPAEIVPRQQERADRIRGMYRQTVETAGEIGRELLAAQSEMDHGQFLPWVTGAVGLSKSTAYRCMDMARSFGPRLPTVGSLPLAVVHKLAEKSTPEPVRAAVLRRIEAGETIQPEAILDEVREAREAAKDAAAKEREQVRRASLSVEDREEEDALIAKGEKGRAARERKQARERDEREEQYRQREAREIEAARVLVDMLGADRAAAYFARYSVGYGKAADVAHTRRARAVPTVEIKASDVYRIGSLYKIPNQEELSRIQAIAKEIECDGVKQSPVVAYRDDASSFRPFRVIDGEDTFLALVDVLNRQVLHVHIAPPVEASDFALLDGSDG